MAGRLNQSLLRSFSATILLLVDFVGWISNIFDFRKRNRNRYSLPRIFIWRKVSFLDYQGVQLYHQCCYLLENPKVRFSGIIVVLPFVLGLQELTSIIQVIILTDYCVRTTRWTHLNHFGDFRFVNHNCIRIGKTILEKQNQISYIYSTQTLRINTNGYRHKTAIQSDIIESRGWWRLAHTPDCQVSVSNR